MDWNVGDIVQLKSGGPAMTITAVSKDGSKSSEVICYWFGTETPYHATFPGEALQAFTKPERRKRSTDVY